jgi:hypothetical protein
VAEVMAMIQGARSEHEAAAQSAQRAQQTCSAAQTEVRGPGHPIVVPTEAHLSWLPRRPLCAAELALVVTTPITVALTRSSSAWRFPIVTHVGCWVRL